MLFLDFWSRIFRIQFSSVYEIYFCWVENIFAIQIQSIDFISFLLLPPQYEALQFTTAIVMFTTHHVCVLCMGFGLGPIEFRPSIKIAKLFTTAFAQCVFFSPLYLINETNRFLAVVSIFSRLLVSFIFIRLFGLKSSKPHQCSAWNRNEDRQWA